MFKNQQQLPPKPSLYDNSLCANLKPDLRLRNIAGGSVGKSQSQFEKYLSHRNPLPRIKNHKKRDSSYNTNTETRNSIAVHGISLPGLSIPTRPDENIRYETHNSIDNSQGFGRHLTRGPFETRNSSSDFVYKQYLGVQSSTPENHSNQLASNQPIIASIPKKKLRSRINLQKEIHQT